MRCEALWAERSYGEASALVAPDLLILSAASYSHSPHLSTFLSTFLTGGSEASISLPSSSSYPEPRCAQNRHT